MTLADTQRLSDGEVFYIIENGVRLTGMPAWGEAGPHDATESWELVHFIRHLPKITAQELAEMESLNPRSRKELEDEQAIRKLHVTVGQRVVVVYVENEKDKTSVAKQVLLGVTEKAPTPAKPHEHH